VIEPGRTIIARIQNRRGLKQDLPQPLRPGELGFAVDSRQLYIGGDTLGDEQQGFSTISVLENTLNSRSNLESISANNLVRFTVPSRIYERGTLTSLTTQLSWLPTSSISASIADPVFSTNITGGANSSTAIKSVSSNSNFTADSILVYRNGVRLSGQNVVSSSQPLSSDYTFTSGSASNSTQLLTLRNLPSSSDSIAITYYSNAQIVNTITEAGTIAGSAIQGFHTQFSLPAYLHIPAENVRVSPTTGVGFIALDYRHIAVLAASSPIDSPNSITLGNLLVSLETDGLSNISIDDSSSGNVIFTVSNTSDFTLGGFVYVTDSTENANISNEILEIVAVGNTTITASITGTIDDPLETVTITPVISFDLSGATSVTDAIAIVEDQAQGIVLFQTQDDVNRIYVTTRPEETSVGVEFTLHEDPVVPTLAPLSLAAGEYTRNTTVKAKLENWLDSILFSSTVNLFTSASVGERYSVEPNINLGTWNLDLDYTYNEITWGSREEARDFNYLANKIYYNTARTDVRGLVNLKTNIEVLTSDTANLGAGLPVITFTNLNQITISYTDGSPAVLSDLTFDAGAFNTYWIDYSVREDVSVVDPLDFYMRAGSLLITADAVHGVAMHDISVESKGSNLVDDLVFSAAMNASDVEISAANALGIPLRMKYTIRRWEG
jgi:hypothetical protein